jgi:hypothetical protein
MSTAEFVYIRGQCCLDRCICGRSIVLPSFAVTSTADIRCLWSRRAEPVDLYRGWEGSCVEGTGGEIPMKTRSTILSLAALTMLSVSALAPTQASARGMGGGFHGGHFGGGHFGGGYGRGYHNWGNYSGGYGYGWRPYFRPGYETSSYSYYVPVQVPVPVRVEVPVPVQVAVPVPVQVAVPVPVQMAVPLQQPAQ